MSKQLILDLIEHTKLLNLQASVQYLFFHKNDYITLVDVQEYIISLIQSFNNKYKITSMISRPLKTVEQKTYEFFRTVEAGDISLFDIFNESIAVYGYTKVGKTSSCHILANSPLRSEQLNGELVYRPATQKYMTATVGLSPESQTQIPNIFQTKIRDQNGKFKDITILDQPGYGDTYGFHRIFSNGYFHYRTFSKTPKLKFILAFKKVDLQGTGQNFKNTIQLFINTFANFDQSKNGILKATSFLVTQADPRSNIENIKKTIQKLRDSSINSMSQEQANRFQGMINFMLDSNKIFIIQKPEKAGVITAQSDILKQIYDKTSFWVREVHNNIVDMKPINFSVATEILNGLLSYKGKALFKQQFDHFMDFMQKRINDFLIHHEFSLKNIVKILQQDAVHGAEDHNFLQGMSQFVGSFYKFNELYKQKREKRSANMFKLTQLDESIDVIKVGMLNNEVAQAQKLEKQRQMKQSYFIKKFKVLQFIHELGKKNANQIHVERAITWLETVSLQFIEMFKKFNFLRVQKSDSEKIIYKYSYIIQRLIEQSKIITLILFSEKQTTAKFDEYKLLMVDIYRPLRDEIFINFQEIKTFQLKQQFITRLNFNVFDVVNKQIIVFLQSTPNLNETTQINIAKLVIKYADYILSKKKNAKEEEKKFIAYKLYDFRNKFYAFLKNIIKQNNKNEKQKCIELIFSLTNNLGNFLSGLHFYDQAREVFKSLNNSEFVFKNFEAEMKLYQADIEKSRSILIKYGKYAGECHRSELAMQCFQKAYAKSKTYTQLKEVKQHIIDLQTERNLQVDDTYLKKFYNDEFCSQFSASLKLRISSIYQQEKVIKPN